MYEIIKAPFNILYQINFVYDLVNNMKYHSHQAIKNANMDHVKTLEGFIHHFIDVIKECILRNFRDIRNIKIDIEFFDEKNHIHIFIKNIYEIMLKNHQNNIKYDYHKSIFVIIYDESDKPHFAGIIGYQNVRKCDVEYLQYTKELRKLNTL
jgi:hypothetical protein